MADKFYTQDIIDRVVEYALRAARASQRGEATVRLGAGDSAQDLLLRQGGYCARFVRQVYETACGLRPFSWRYAAPSALEMCARLEADGHAVSADRLVPGDILGINRNSGKYGHIAVYVGRVDGVETIAENTSSTVRGNPRRAGTKLTPHTDIAHRVTGVYRLLHNPGGLRWPDFRAFVDVNGTYREIVLAPGGDHRRGQGKTYWRFR